jgi:hypothetical protein
MRRQLPKHALLAEVKPQQEHHEHIRQEEDGVEEHQEPLYEPKLLRDPVAGLGIRLSPLLDVCCEKVTACALRVTYGCPPER